MSRRKLADLRVHAVLDCQHDDGCASGLQALEQTALQLQVLGLLTQHCCRQLLGVSHKNSSACITIESQLEVVQ